MRLYRLSPLQWHPGAKTARGQGMLGPGGIWRDHSATHFHAWLASPEISMCYIPSLKGRHIDKYLHINMLADYVSISVFCLSAIFWTKCSTNSSPLALIDNGRKKQFRVMFQMISCTQMWSQSQEMVCAPACSQIVLKSTKQFSTVATTQQGWAAQTHIVYIINFPNGKLMIYLSVAQWKLPYQQNLASLSNSVCICRQSKGFNSSHTHKYICASTVISKTMNCLPDSSFVNVTLVREKLETVTLSRWQCLVPCNFT